MSLNDVNIEQKDGGLGSSGATAEGLHIKIGAATGTSKNQILIISSAEDVKKKVGTGVLASRLLDSIGSGASTVYAVIANASTAGTSSEVTKDGTGKATFALTGTPNDEYDVRIRILKGGTLNEAVCEISVDGGDSYAPKKIVPTNGAVLVDGTDVTITFTAGAPAADSFVVGDVYKFTTTAPKITNADFLAALDVVKNSPLDYESVHVCGETAAALWTLCAAEADTMFDTLKRPVFFVCEARNKTAAESIDQYVTALVTEKGSFTSRRVAVVAGRGELAALDGTVRDSNVAPILMGFLARAKVSESPGKVRKFPMPLMTDLRPTGIKDAHIQILDEAGFITARRYIDYAGFYVTNFRMMAPEGSDYGYGEVRRTADKISRQLRKASIGFMQFEGDASGIAAYKAALEQPLNEMKKETVREINDFEVVIPPGQDLLSNPEIKAEVSFVPIPIMRSMKISQMVRNPFLES